MITTATILGACLFVFLVGSLAEYFIHRWMHGGTVLGQKHAEHHAEGVGQGWFGEFKDYLLPALLPAALTWLVSFPVGLGATLGAFVYAAAAAYSHQLQHERPELVFWLNRPVHALHHEHKMWHHNFGILVDVWDRAFGTYRPEGAREPRPDAPLSAWFKIKWY